MLIRQPSRVIVALALLLGLIVAPFAASARSGASDWTTTAPFRVLDTRAGQVTIDGKFAGIGQRDAGSSTELQLIGRAGIPSTATTVLLNVTAVNPSTAGYLTVYPCGTTRPNASNVNYAAGDIQSNLVVAPIDNQGRTCIYTHARTDIVADIEGYASGVITNVAPSRLLDSRAGQVTIDGKFAGIGQRDAGSSTELQLIGRAGIPSTATTVLLNVTAVNPSAAGYLTVYPCGTTRPNASNVNYAAGDIQSNLVVAPIDNQGRTCIYTHARTDIVADIEGYASGVITNVAPSRLLDSRAGQVTIDGKFAGIGQRDAGSSTELQLIGRAGIPSTATTVLLNVTAVNPSTAGYLTVYPCGTTRPNASNVNYAAGDIQSNLVVAPIDNQGRTCIYTHARTDIVADIQGYVIGATIVQAFPQVVASPPAGAGFVHPGVFVDRAQLDEIKQNVAAGREPWAGALSRIYNSGGSERTALRPTSYRFSSLSYVPAPVPVVQAASGGTLSYVQTHGLTETGAVEHLDDARAAYTQALLWYVTGNHAHADKAIEIMNAWSSTLTEIRFDQPRRVDNGQIIWMNGKLQAGWGGSLFARAAEIIRYSGAGWSNNDIARFEAMLHNVYLPLVITGWTNGANWLTTFAEATIEIAVFTNDRAAFNTGIATWRAKTPTTIYDAKDGPLPITPAAYLDTASEINAYWYSPTRYITGLQGESLRDLSHMTMGLGAMANAAETAEIQGIDLYAEQAPRIIAGFELNAGYVNAYLDEIARLGGNPPSTWIPPNWPGPAGSFKNINTYYQAGWLVAQHHYTALGIAMPQTTRLVQRLGTNAAQPALHLSWEQLTHSS